MFEDFPEGAHVQMVPVIVGDQHMVHGAQRCRRERCGNPAGHPRETVEARVQEDVGPVETYEK